MRSPDVEALVTNVNTGGEWIVIQTITSSHGPFNDRVDAERFAAALRGRSVKDVRRSAPLGETRNTTGDPQ